MWRWRRRLPPPLRGTTPQIFSSRAASAITHVLINGEFNHHISIGCRFVPRGGYYTSLASAAGAQIGPPSPDDGERKQTTAGASFPSSGARLIEQGRRPHGRGAEISNGLRGDLLDLARRFSNDAEAQRLRPDPATSAAATVRSLCWSGVKKSISSSDKDSGFDVLAMFDFLPVVAGGQKNHKRPGDVVIDEAFDAVVRGYARLKMPDRASQTFFQLCDRGYVPCINTCNFLMALLVGCGDMKSVEDVHSQIKKRPPQLLRPNRFTFRIMAEALCSQGKWCDGLFLLSREMLEEEGIKPDSSSMWSALIRGVCALGMPDLGYDLLQRVRMLRGVHTTTINYNHVIAGYCRIGEVFEAEEVLEDMVRHGVPPDVCTYGSLIRGLCDLGLPDLGYERLQDARKLGGIHMTTINYNHVISRFCRIGKLFQAEEVLADMVRQGVPPDVYTYGSLIRGYCSLCNISRVSSLLDDMDIRGIKINCVIENSIMHCVSEFVKNAKDSGQIVDKVLYNIAIDAQCKLGKMEEAVETLQEMRGCGFVPDTIHYNTLINGYCRIGEINDARKTFRSMTDAGLKPDVVTYNTLASGFAKSGLVGETLGVLYQMLDHGVEPDSVTCASVVKGVF